MRKKANQYGFSQCHVSKEIFQTPRKGYKLADISRVDIRRTPFFLTLPFLIGLLSMMFFYSELIYGSEIFMGLLAVAVLGGASFSIGTINLTGFNVSGMATLGLYRDMQKLKTDLDAAMGRSTRSSRRAGRYAS